VRLQVEWATGGQEEEAVAVPRIDKEEDKLRLLDEDVRTDLVEVVHSIAMYRNPTMFLDEG
jgi:hypothetical protein